MSDQLNPPDLKLREWGKGKLMWVEDKNEKASLRFVRVEVGEDPNYWPHPKRLKKSIGSNNIFTYAVALEQLRGELETEVERLKMLVKSLQALGQRQYVPTPEEDHKQAEGMKPVDDFGKSFMAKGGG